MRLAVDIIDGKSRIILRSLVFGLLVEKKQYSNIQRNLTQSPLLPSVLCAKRVFGNTQGTIPFSSRRRSL